MAKEEKRHDECQEYAYDDNRNERCAWVQSCPYGHSHGEGSDEEFANNQVDGPGTGIETGFTYIVQVADGTVFIHGEPALE